MAEPKFVFERKELQKVNKMGEEYTENCAGRRAFATPESWYSLIDHFQQFYNSVNKDFLEDDPRGCHYALRALKARISELHKSIHPETRW